MVRGAVHLCAGCVPLARGPGKGSRSMATPIQQPLSLVLQLKSATPTPPALTEMNAALPDILHFAWLIALDDKGKLLLSTVYDGDFDIYLDKFIDSSHAAFDALLPNVKDGPPTP